MVDFLYKKSGSVFNQHSPPNPPNPKSDNSPNSIRYPMKDTSNEGLKPLLMNYKDVQKYFGDISPSTVKR